MPVETKYTPEGLEPSRVRETSQKLSSAVLQNHDFGDGRGKLSHTLEKPFWSSAAV
jgi:hypothetical protein